MPLTQDTIFFIVISILVLVFVVQNIILRGKLKSIFRGGANANLEKTLEEQIKKTAALEQETKRQQKNIDSLGATLEKAIQKIGITRFNSFDESSANQSFSIAALDAKNNGFVLTNLQMREGGRTYAKPIEKGVPQYKLSQEEEATLKQAMEKQ